MSDFKRFLFENASKSRSFFSPLSEYSVSAPETTVLSADSAVELEVTVRNTGDRPGKTVVQLYYTAPYKDGGIEKAHVVLADFLKTEELDAGQSATYTLSLNARDMASYDYSDTNGNGFSGYELESCTYAISVRTDAHSEVASYDFSLAEGVRYETSESDASVKIGNLFDDVSFHIDEYLSKRQSFANASVLVGVLERKTVL